MIKQIKLSMNPYQVAETIAAEIPEVQNELNKPIVKRNPFALIRIVARYTTRMKKEDNDGMVSKCMLLLESIYTKGDHLVQYAVENEWVISLNNLLGHYAADRNTGYIKKLLPLKLHSAYMVQLHTAR